MNQIRTKSSPDWAPFRIDPVFVGRVWGYRDLRPWFDRVADTEPIGEVWLTGNQCVAATGAQAGQRLDHLFGESREELLGPAALGTDSPLLIKVILAAEKLSVQVHPDDALAHKYGLERGKTECWYALAAKPGAQVAVGLRAGISASEVRAAIESNTLEQDLNLLPIAAGDMVYVDAGTVHAIWPGSILLEVQQNSDVTYRMYDYGRPRELHVEQGLEAMRMHTRAGKIAPTKLGDRTILIDVEYFCIERVPVATAISSKELSETDTSRPGLAYLFAAAGAGTVSGDGFEAIDLPPRSIVCVPAAAPEFAVKNQGDLDLIRITPKWDAFRL